MGNNKIKFCYLCGKATPKPNTRDHIPPKSLFPKGNWNNQERLTMPTHFECNKAYSDDEQYFSTLIIPSGIDIFYDAREAFKPVKRNWEREAGLKQLSSILKKAIPIELKTKKGHEKAIGIYHDESKTKRVVWKMARGIVSYDTHCYVNEEKEKLLFHYDTLDLQALIKSKDNKEAFAGLFTKAAIHYQPIEHAIIRRCYYLVGEGDNSISVCALIAIMIYTSSYIVLTDITVEKSSLPTNLILLAWPNTIL